MFHYLNKTISMFFQNLPQDSKNNSVQTFEKPDYRTISIFIIVAFSVVMVRYLGDSKFLVTSIEGFGLNSFASFLKNLFFKSNNASLFRLSWWATCIIFFYFLIPFSILKFVWKEKISDYGMKLKGAFKHYKVYFIMLIVMIPLVLFFSTTKSFQLRYPFYKPIATESLFPKFIIWESFYFVQFIAVEFFFRGFMVHGLKRFFGFYSVFIMMIPYCMVHFGKPMPETIAAIFAGIVLGFLSLKSKSIYLGIAIHYSVAITMDLLALQYLR